MRLLRKLGALSIACGNIWSWAVILTGVSNNNIETSDFVLSVCVILATYFFGLFKLLGALKPYRGELVLDHASPLGRAVLKSNNERNVYMTYEVKEDRVSEDDWKVFKAKMEDYAKSFLEKYYPTVGVDFEFRLLDQKLDNNLNGRHTALYSYFGDHDNYIYLSDWLVHASIHCDDFSIVVPTLSHELVHYALFKLGKGHRDGQNDFEKELERIGLPSNQNRKFMAINVSRKEEDGKTIAKIYISKNEQSKPSLGMEKIIKRA
jgi:hypothetical protein